MDKVSPINKKKKAKWLSSYIKKDLKQYPSPNVWEKIIEYFSTIYVPSTKTIFFILSIVFVIWVSTNSGKMLALLNLNNWIIFYLPYYSEESNQFQNLIAIHAGIGTIIFALIILIAESLRDDQSKDTARVLLKVSYLFPLTVAEIFVFFLFLFGNINFLCIISVIIIALFTVISLKNTIKVLLDKPLFTTKRTELLNEEIKKDIDRAIDERIGNSIFLEILKNLDQKLNYQLFSLDESNYYIINSENFGVVIDINIGLLAEIAELIQDEAEKNGTRPNRPQIPIHDRQITETSRTDGQKDIHLNVHKRYQENILEGNRTLLSFRKSYVTDAHVLEKIRSKAQKAFRLTPQDNFDDLVKSQLSDLKGQFSDAITNHKLNVVEELCKIYIGLTEGYLNSMEPYGGGFSFEQARSERAAVFMGGWEKMRWLASDVHSLIVEAIHGESKEILFETVGLPFRISRLAIQKDDHYLFQEFSWFPNLFYRYSKKEELSSDFRQYLFDKSWRQFQDLSDYYINTKLEKNISEDKKQSLKNYAISILLTFQNLMKAAYDNKDIDAFEKFKQTATMIFKIKDLDYTKYEIEILKSQLITPNISTEEIEQIKNQLEKKLIHQEIHARKLQMFFGLASWITDEYKRDKENDKIQEFINCIEAIFNNNLEKFTKIFLDVHSYDMEHFWGWDNWDIIPDGEVYSIRTLERLEQFFAVKALLILASQTQERIDQIELPYNRDLALLADGAQDLVKILDDIKCNPENWQFILSEDAIAKVDVLKNLLTRVKEKQKEEDIKRIRETNISVEKIEQFKEEFLKGFYKNALIRNFIGKISALEKKLSEKPKETIARLGFNTVDDKSVFFDDWHVYYNEWGESYGQNLALGENSALIDKIIKSCDSLADTDLENVLNKFTNLDVLLIILVNHSSLMDYQGEEGFRYQRSEEDSSIIGYYQIRGIEVPIYQFFLNDVEKQIIILDKRKLGKLVQYSPLIEGDSADFVKDMFLMDIQSFSENEVLMNDMLDNPPDWLQEKGDREAQRNYLEEHVLIKLQERFKLILSEDFQGYSLHKEN